MKIFKFKKFIDRLRSVSLSPSEKEFLRSDFLQKTGLHDFSKPSLIQGIFLVRYSKILVYSFLIFATAITPFTFAAEYSQPGDILYPLKVSFNEPIKQVVKYISRPIKQFSEKDEEPKTKSSDNDKADEHTKNNSKLNSKKSDFSSSRKDILQKQDIPVEKIINENSPLVPKDIDSDRSNNPNKEVDEEAETDNEDSELKQTEDIIKKNKEDATDFLIHPWIQKWTKE